MGIVRKIKLNARVPVILNKQCFVVIIIIAPITRVFFFEKNPSEPTATEFTLRSIHTTGFSRRGFQRSFSTRCVYSQNLLSGIF